MRVQDNGYCYGSVALEVEQPRFIVHEGGRVHSECDEERVTRAVSPVVLAVAALLFVVVLGAAMLRQSLLQHRVSEALGSAPIEQHVVRDGDTLWSIAEDCGVQGVPVRDVVSWIEQTNSLDGGLIVAGQSLAVPQGLLS